MSIATISIENLQHSDKTTKVLNESKAKLGFTPNMYLGMAGNTSLIDSYLYAYDSFRAHSNFTSVEQEVIFLSVSYFNNCEYCTAAHSFIADKMSGVPTDITNAIRSGEELPDEKLNALSVFTKLMVEKRGWVEQQEVDSFFEAGYNESHLLGIITAIAVKTMSNYSNHVTKPALDDVFAGRKWTKEELGTTV